MGITAPVKDGKIVESSVSAAADSDKTREVSNSMDKDAFLQLLVAQMKYQDPLEPTSNTEYVAQLATFSELEAMTNLNESMSVSRASELVGKKVTIQTTSATTGEITEAQGTVDYVLVENNKAYLVIDGNPYSIDDLSSVMTDDYWKQYQDALQGETSETAVTIMAAIATLPEDTADITLEHKDFVAAIRKAYDGLSSDDKLQVQDDYLVRLIKAENRIKKLEAEQAKDSADTDTSDKTEEDTTGDDV